MIQFWNIRSNRVLRKAVFIVLPFVALSLMVAPILIAFAQTESLIRFDPSPTYISPEELIRIDLIIEDANQLFGFEVHIQFDPEVIQVVDLDPDTQGVQSAPGNMFDENQGFLVANNTDNQTGEIVYAFTLLAPASPMNADGILISIEFQATSVGQSELNLISVILATQDGESLPFSSVNGEVYVSANQDATQSPIDNPISPSLSPTSYDQIQEPTQTIQGSSTQEMQLPNTNTPTPVPTSTKSQKNQPTSTSTSGVTVHPVTDIPTITPSPKLISEVNQISNNIFEIGWPLFVLFVVLFILIRIAKYLLERDKTDK